MRISKSLLSSGDTASELREMEQRVTTSLAAENERLLNATLYALKVAKAMVADAAPSPEYATRDNPAYSAAVDFRDAMLAAIQG